MNKYDNTRRKFLGSSAILAGTLLTVPSLLGMPSILQSCIPSHKKPNSLINGVQIGVITYTYRSMPDQTAEGLLQYIVDSGINATELMGDPVEFFAGKPESPVPRPEYLKLRNAPRWGKTLTEDQKKELAEMEVAIKAYTKELAAWRVACPMDKFVELRKMYNDAGVSIYAVKLSSALGRVNTVGEINWAMEVAKTLGANQITYENPGDDAHTKKLGEIAKKHKIYVAYHNHLQGTPTFWDTALKQSEYNAMNLDFGHYVAAGNPDPVGFVKSKHDRIKSMHIKDRRSPENGQDFMPWGKGDTPLVEVLQLMRDEKYTFPATIELNYDFPEGSDAVQEVKKCMEFCRNALS